MSNESDDLPPDTDNEITGHSLARRRLLQLTAGSGGLGLMGNVVAETDDRAETDDVSPDTVTDLEILDPTETTEYADEVDAMFRWEENHVFGPYRSVISIGSEEDPEEQEIFVYEPGEEIRDLSDSCCGEYTMTEIVELEEGIPEGPHDLTVRVQEEFPPGSDEWGFDQVRTVEDAILVDPDAPPRFLDLRAGKLEMATQIESVSETILERERIEGLLDQIESAMEDDDLDPDVAEDAVERMIRGEDLTEVSLASLTPVTVSSPQETPSYVGEPPDSPAADENVDIVGKSISLGVGALSSILLGLKALRGLSSVVKRALNFLDNALDILSAVVSALQNAIPFIQGRANENAEELADDTEEMIEEEEEEDGENIVEFILEEIRRRYRDPLVAQYMSSFESGFESGLREFDDNFEPDPDGSLELSGSNDDAMEAADIAKNDLVTVVLAVDGVLDTLDLIVELSDYLAAIAVLLTATGIASTVGAAAGLISQILGISVGSIGSITGFSQTFTIRSTHNDGLDAIASGGA